MPTKHAFTSPVTDDGDPNIVGSNEWNADHTGNSLTAIVVAANDSSAADKNNSDLLCDGAADDVQIQAAIDAMPTRGGDIILAPGEYIVSGIPTITANKRINIWAAGAVISVPSAGTGLKINQGSTGGSRRGVYVYGLRVDGGNFTDNIGIDFTDTNWSGLFGVQIENIARGILMHASAANEFVEGITLEDVIIRSPNVYGIELRRTGGTNSFGQHSWRSVSLNLTGTATGILIPNTTSMYRSRLEIGVWVGSGQTAVNIDGDMDNADVDLFVEGATGSTGNTGLLIGSNATNLDKMNLHYSTWGTVNTNITNASNKLFMYRQGRRFYGSGGASPIQAWAHGSSGPSVTLEHGGPAGGRITLGSQAGGLQDVNIYRSNSDVLSSEDKFDPASLNLQVKAGTPVDGDVVGGAASGDIIYDTSTGKMWVRNGSTWTRTDNPIISRGGTLLNSAGVATANVIVWRAPYACTVTNVRGYRVGGTGATINARKNGSSNHLASALSLTSADTWTDGGAVQNTAYAAGDKLEIMVVSVTGTPTQIAVQVDFTR